MGDVWIPRVNRFFEKIFNIKGAPTVTGLSSDLVPVFPIQTGVEDRATQDWRRYAVFGQATGGAGQNAAVQLHNPAGSNTIAVVERVAGRSAAAVVFNISFSGPSAIADGSVITPQRLDSRATGGSSMVVSTFTNQASDLAVILFTNQVGAQAEYAPIVLADYQVVVTPGSAVMVRDLTVADTLLGLFTWRERPMELSELTP